MTSSNLANQTGTDINIDVCLRDHNIKEQSALKAIKMIILSSIKLKKSDGCISNLACNYPQRFRELSKCPTKSTPKPPPHRSKTEKLGLRFRV